MALKVSDAKFSIRGAVTESAANTFTEIMIDTNIGIQSNTVFFMTAITWSRSLSIDQGGDGYQGQLCYSSQTGIIDINQSPWLAGFYQSLHVTTSGAQFDQRIWRQAYDAFPIAVPQLYLGALGTNMGSAGVLCVKIEGYLQKVSQSEFYRLVNQR